MQKTLSENIDYLEMRGNELSVELPQGNEFLDEVTVNIYMLCPFVQLDFNLEKVHFGCHKEEEGGKMVRYGNSQSKRVIQTIS